MKLGSFHTIAEPDQPACWLRKNVRVKGYVGEVDRPTDQYILRPLDLMFQEACRAMPSDQSRPQDDSDARIVSVEEIDDYGSLLFKWEYWGVPER